MAGPDALVPLGVVTGAHGVHGELRVKPYNPSSSLLLTSPRALLRGPGADAPREVALQSARWHRDELIVRLETCAQREDALALRGGELCLRRAQLPALAEGEHYLVDLVGLSARRADGTPIGRVVEAIEYPASQVLRVDTARGTIELPMLEPYLVEIRLDEGIVIVDHVEDLDVERKPRAPRG